MKLKDKYKKELLPRLIEELKLKNKLEAPKMVKVVLNVGFGRCNKDKVFIANVVSGLEKITGQKPILTKAKKSISSFKIREGMIIGACVTLRKDMMYDFVEKLIKVTFPRVRDFRGISDKSVDRGGNITIGFKEHIAFPEISSDEIENLFGLEISIHTTAKTRKEGLALFEMLEFPFKKDK
ncbi:50S ribosomal protein L5 [Candidatus Falkowbacteria bacterium RIFOXYB2_FULL_34_18]|uniref:Large ribosomal subunit protein uL5 n=1 Tax=Candidatus Falkowbacteria bacterium RIFOXYD2_FULL_34_120 TaxID=1798007 RepID=A0A1F5TSQ2_9BACT|nr:MAG: 50S ribosomal protein L5 [Candidatus Falkowbacteria bacterium RIFOXYB2_FULL_34_18]OGF30058.1 MAG: 50S ribosomal protein L5 [Candidatus Falkowbacteria bacterium RIFOXYC12_FULL_34_55]OGF37609.1 MAG: 50S ribosomal protein L5 [Candidatus Falkowbacteria bacterium RIFOXYC2_FULL_34_220]OGF39364.1 MAG: 50S ribosomal protein L5 [Candidatus Falkowbacteria bacterium RIFOXYD12_FULL_34_57]OGF41869.1 MAG: 50S ribosomal protein L5 [Candidatus Falkowbacteria bacterium RIFOXYD2_FULL_34_120]